MRGVSRLALIGLTLLACVGAAAAQQRPPLMLSQLTWFDRSGKNLGTIGPLADHGNIELSPDGTRVASARVDQAMGTRDIWVYTAAAAPVQLTSTPLDENWMVWSADGARAIVNAFGPQLLDLFEIPVRAGGPQRRLSSNQAAWPVSLSPDGQSLLVVTNHPRSGNDIWVLPMNGTQPAYPFQSSAAAENWATFSPDGRFVAFSTTESGMSEVVITPFPGPGPKWRVSAETGTQARWRRSDELIYIDGERRLTAASLRMVGDTVELAGVASLFAISYPYGAYHAFDVTRDGQRILVNTVIVSGQEPASIAQVIAQPRGSDPAAPIGPVAAPGE
jgi:dipeptidyl aminopeptidase/acylaminoacyl peptidase